MFIQFEVLPYYLELLTLLLELRELLRGDEKLLLELLLLGVEKLLLERVLDLVERGVENELFERVLLLGV